MNKIFEQAKDLHVVATIVYGNGEDTKAYIDAECTKQFKVSELKEVFIKGALINVNNELYNAVSFINGAINYIGEAESNVAIVSLSGAAEEE